MDHTREAGRLGATLDAAWDTRVKAADDWNTRLEAGKLHPGFWLRVKWFFISVTHGRRYGQYSKEAEEQWRTKDGRKEPSLAWALNDTFGYSFWLGGCFKVCDSVPLTHLPDPDVHPQVFGDTTQLMGPLLIKVSLYPHCFLLS